MSVHLGSISGGKDGDCIYALGCDWSQRTGKPFRPIFADTGHEHEWTYEQVHNLPRWTNGPAVEIVKADFTDAITRRRERLPGQWSEAGVPQRFIDRALEILHPTGVPYLDLVLSKGMFAAGATRKFCTELLKVIPIQQQVVDPLLASGERVVQWLGIRADESKRRADPALHPRFQRVGTQLMLYRPILHWTIDTVVQYHDWKRIPLNPLYKHGLDRVGCWPCVNEGKANLAIITRRFPEAIEKVRGWEALVSEVNVSWRKPEGFGDICTFFPAGMVPGLERNTIDDVARWSLTKRGGKQYDMFAGRLVDTNHFACTAGMGFCETGEAA